jgi:membrane-associated phospholipid phosphatase
MPMSNNTQPLYRMCVRGRLSQTGAAWFEGFTLTVVLMPEQSNSLSSKNKGLNKDMNKTNRIAKLTLSAPKLQHGVTSWLLVLALAALLIAFPSGVAAGVWSGEGFAFDRAVMQAIHHQASPWLTTLMLLITDSASSLVTTGLILGLSIRWWWQVERRAAVFFLIVTPMGSAALGRALKHFFARPRPHLFPWLTGAGDWSFPSGHTLNAVVLAGLLAWLIGRQLSGWRRGALWVIAGLWAGLVGLSRVYLGVHYPSDVLASLPVGGFCLLAALHGYRMSISQPEA